MKQIKAIMWQIYHSLKKSMKTDSVTYPSVSNTLFKRMQCLLSKHSKCRVLWLNINFTVILMNWINDLRNKSTILDVAERKKSSKAKHKC